MAPPRSELWQYVTIVRQASGPTGVQKLVYVFENTKPVNKDAPLDDGLDSLGAAFSDEE